MLSIGATMPKLTVRAGLYPDLCLPSSQILLLGKQNLMKKLTFDGVLAKKLEVDGVKLFERAMQCLEKPGSVPLYPNLAQIVSFDDWSRSDPFNTCAIFKAVNQLSVCPKVEQLSIVLYSEYQDVLASVASIAKALPYYTLKTSDKETWEKIDLEIVVDSADGQTLNEVDLKFLQNLSDNIRTCSRLVDMPSNILHTEAFAKEAIALAKGLGADVQETMIMDENLRDEGFGGIYSVGKAADNPPIFLCLSYKSAGATESCALVGNGITLKPLSGNAAPGTLKIDMGSAGAVLSAFCTLVQAGFKQNLHCLLCIAGNSVSPIANKPNDVITLLSGNKCKITNTDAQGRRLADGVFYAKSVLKANIIIDVATLSGDQSFSLMNFTGLHTAILANTYQLEADAIKAGKKSGDLVHRLPFCPELHFSDMKSVIADMINANQAKKEGQTRANQGKKEGPPSALGLFIGAQIDFGNDLKWLHVDIDASATGFGVSLIATLLAHKYTNVSLVAHEPTRKRQVA